MRLGYSFSRWRHVHRGGLILTAGQETTDEGMISSDRRLIAMRDMPTRAHWLAVLLLFFYPLFSGDLLHAVYFPLSQLAPILFKLISSQPLFKPCSPWSDTRVTDLKHEYKKRDKQVLGKLEKAVSVLGEEGLDASID